jgi:hypothetical protein
VLNTLTERDFQNAFKKCRTAGNDGYAWKCTTLVVASRPKDIFCQVAAPVPEVMDSSDIVLYAVIK